MKYVLIIPDGCADESQAVLGHRTPLQAAETPNMDAIARAGFVGRADHVPASMTPGSDVGTMSLLGYDPLKYHSGRAPLETAAQGIELGPNDWAIRCNLVTIEYGVMQSFTAGQIPSELGRELIERLQKDQPGDSNWNFHPGVSYRNLLIYRSTDKEAPFNSETKTVPPHDITDRQVNAYLPSGPGSEELRRLMQRSCELFQKSTANQQRQESGERPATGIWLWGLGKKPDLEPFAQRFGKSGAVITAVDLLRGLGRILGWQIVDVPGATGYTDTDYAAKCAAAIQTLTDVDFVVVHIEATDEASHEGNAQAKVEALEQIDSEIVGPLHAFLKHQGDFRILVSPDHPTLLRTKTHSHGDVPFAMCGTGLSADSAEAYDEATAARSRVAVKGYELMPMFFDEPKIGNP